MPLRVQKHRIDFKKGLTPTGLTATYTGTPTGASVSGGQLELVLAATNEAETLRVDLGDNLAFPVNDVQEVRIRAKLERGEGAAGDNVSAALGIAGAGAADPADLSGCLLFEIATDDAVTIRANDGTVSGVDTSGIETDVEAGDDWRTYVFDLRNGLVRRELREGGDIAGKGAVLAKVSNDVGLLRPVAEGSVIDLTDWADVGVQPYVQIAKTSSTDTGTLTVDWIEIFYRETVEG